MNQNYIVDKLTLADLTKSGKIIIPSFQRGIVWNKEHRKDFIETVKSGDPFGVVLVSQEKPGNPYILIDGLQRLSTLKAYMSNPLEFVDENDKFIDKDKLNKIFLQKYSFKGLQLPKDEKLEKEKKVFLKKMISLMKEKETTPKGTDIWRSLSNYLQIPKLTSQFRCLGGETYTSFIKSMLNYTDENIKFSLSKNKYDFKVFDSPKEMFEAIKEKDQEEQEKICLREGKLFNDYSFSGKCRLVSGYTHDWISKGEDRSGVNFDFKYDDGFNAKWNLFKSGEYSWANDPLSVDEIGCIHTCQGIDLNYCGVIIGKDLTYENDQIQINTETHPTKDKAFCKKTDRELVKKIIRNTYYVLLTRGIKGCYIYCEDKALNEYIKSLIIE